jgi:hypothetical protein
MGRLVPRFKDSKRSAWRHIYRPGILYRDEYISLGNTPFVVVVEGLDMAKRIPQHNCLSRIHSSPI